MAHLDGYWTVIANIEKEVNSMRGRTLLGMTKAMNFLHRETETTIPMVPRRTNFLAQSWFVIPSKTGINPEVKAGYTAKYAPIVHEMREHRQGTINWTRQGSSDKWLQIQFDRNKREMELIIAKYARITP